MTFEETQALLKELGFPGCERDGYGRLDDCGDRVVIRYFGELRFETLNAVANYFGTSRIDLGADDGCASDPSADPYVIVWAPLPTGARFRGV